MEANKANETIKNIVASEPQLREVVNEVKSAFIHLATAVAKLSHLLGKPEIAAKFAVLKGWIGNRNLADVVLGWVLCHFVRNTLPTGCDSETMWKWLVARFRAIGETLRATEIDPESAAVSSNTVLYALVPQAQAASSAVMAGVQHEALNINSTVRATGGSHNSSSVRFFAKNPAVPDSFDFIGMGLRYSKENLLMPLHVFDRLLDGEVKVKGANRNVCSTTIDPTKVVFRDEEHDFVVYNAGVNLFSRTATSLIKMNHLERSRRTFLLACREGDEKGTVSEGMPKSTSHNFLYAAGYSSVPGHSGGAVCQMKNGSLAEVGMHLGHFSGENTFVTLDGVAMLMSPPSNRQGEAVVSVSSSSHGSEDEYQQNRNRILAANYVREFRAEQRRTGVSHFDEELEDEWKQVDATLAADEFKRNKEEFVKNFNYTSEHGWISRRKGGKSRGGVKVHESVPKRQQTDDSLAVAVLCSLKGSERQPAALIQAAGTQGEPERTSSKTSISPVLPESAQSNCKEEESSRSVEPTQSPVMPSNSQQEILNSLKAGLESGILSKSAIRKLVDNSQVPVTTSSTQGGTKLSPQSEQTKN